MNLFINLMLPIFIFIVNKSDPMNWTFKEIFVKIIPKI